MRAMIRWAVHHPTLVNLLMVAFCVLGLISVQAIPKEVFPETALDMVMIRIPYRGASPNEVEKGIILSIEEAIQQVDGIEQVTAEAMENLGMLRVEVSRGFKPEKVLRDIKDQLDQITSFPQDADRPLTFEVVRRVPVMQFALYGEVSRQAMQQLSQQVKDELLPIKGVSQVTIEGYKQPEISIEIDEARLRQYGLQLAEVGRAVLATNLDLSGGMLQTRREDLQIRVYGKRYLASQFRRIPIRTARGGTPLYLEDIATIRERFENRANRLLFDAKPALLLTVLRGKEGDSIAIAARLRAYLKRVNQRLPSKVKLGVYSDRTVDLVARLQLLSINGLQGLILVLLTLSLFMNLRLAFWVAMGLPISILGTIIIMYMTGVTVNMISMFGMILVLGILVDDAIVIGENVYAHIERGVPPMQAAVDGTVEVLPAVFAAVTTTMVAFVPLFFLGGRIGSFIGLIPAVVIMCLAISLLESMFLLPSHLGHSLQPIDNATHVKKRWRELFDGAFHWLNRVCYGKMLQQAIQYRWAVLGGGLAMLLLCMGLVRGGAVRFVFFPALDGDRIVARFVMKPGTPERETTQLAQMMLKHAKALNQSLHRTYGKDVIIRSLVMVGQQTLPSGDFSPPSGEEVGEVQLELLPGEQRKISSQKVLLMWRQMVGSIPHVLRLSFATLDTPPVGRPMEIQLQSQDRRQLVQASAYLKKRLLSFAGISDFENDFTPGKRELRLRLTPLAHSLEVSLQEVAQQIRHRMYGQEVMRLQRGRDEVRVFVRYPDRQRRLLSQLKGVWIRAANGQEYPLTSLATWSFARDLQVIRRINRQQVMTVTTSIDETKANRQEIVAVLMRDDLPKLRQIAPAVKVVFAGQGKEQGKTFAQLRVVFPMALFGIFVILVAALQSYSQAFVVMAMIPFGLIGAILGHYVMGAPLTILSLFGIVGLSGVVVNDSLVLVDAINRYKSEGMELFQAAWESGQSRLRPVLSTTLTTCIGLGPILLEKSRQAQFLIPMAISLAFGVLFATIITLFLTPSFLLVIEDVNGFIRWLRTGEWDAPAEKAPETGT